MERPPPGNIFSFSKQTPEKLDDPFSERRVRLLNDSRFFERSLRSSQPSYRSSTGDASVSSTPRDDRKRKRDDSRSSLGSSAAPPTASLPNSDAFDPYGFASHDGDDMYAYNSGDDLLHSSDGTKKARSGDDDWADDLDSEFFEEDFYYSDLKGLDDWNSRFQECKSIIEEFDANTPIQDRISVNVTLIYLYQDFLFCVRTYSKIIVSELYLPYQQKTIKPMADMGGVAGGLKYRVNNILFKFAINSSGLYGDDYAASKVAGHELKSLISYMNCEERSLHFPLMALVDYRGYRILAMSVLPITKETIRYGTMDAGATIHAGDEELLESLKRTAGKLNLKPHLVSDQQRRTSMMFYSAADVEGHRGIDNRLYLLDFSRTFPPETPDKSVRMSHLFRLLRPEFVASYPKPLCPDAFTKFVATEALRDHNNEVRDATARMLSEKVPAVARELDQQLEELSSCPGGALVQHFRMIELVHANGVNIRYLGHVRAESKNAEIRYLLLLEMLARLLKTCMRLQLRETVRKLKVPLEQPYRKLLVDYLNLVFGESDKSTRYWREKLRSKLIRKYPHALTEAECAPEHDLKKQLEAPAWGGKQGRALLFEKVREMVGLRFAAIVHTQLDSNPAFLLTESPLDYVDLEELQEVVKHTNVIAHSQGYLLKMKGLMKNKAKDHVSANRFFQMAVEKCEESLNTNPNHKLTLRNCAQLLTFLGGALQGKSGDWNSPTMRRANSYYVRALRADPHDAHSTFQYARFLAFCRRSELAEDYFLKTLELDPHFERCLQEYGAFLRQLGKTDAAERIAALVGTHDVQHKLNEYQEGFKSGLRASNRLSLSSSAAQPEQDPTKTPQTPTRSSAGNVPSFKSQSTG